MKVLIYVNTAAQVGDIDHLVVFADEDAMNDWLAKHDPEGVAFEYPVLESLDPRPLVLPQHPDSETE